MTFRPRVILAALALTFAAVAPAGAQTNPCAVSGCTVTDHVSMVVGTVVRLQLSQTATVLSSPDTSAFNTGSLTTAGPTVSVRANRSWTLSVKAGAATFTPGLGAAGFAKPASDLGLALAGGNTVSGLTTANQTLATGASGGTFSGAVTYTTKVAWNKDIPDTYSLDVVYTVTAP